MNENFFIMVSLLHGGHYAQLNLIQSTCGLESKRK